VRVIKSSLRADSRVRSSAKPWNIALWDWHYETNQHGWYWRPSVSTKSRKSRLVTSPSTSKSKVRGSESEIKSWKPNQVQTWVQGDFSGRVTERRSKNWGENLDA